MIWLSLIAFLVSSVCAAFIIRLLKGRRTPHYDDELKPQRFHVGEVPRMGGVALLLGLCVSWGVGVIQSQSGDPASLRLGTWTYWWIVALLPAALGGIVEDMTQRMTVRYRLALTLLSGGDKAFVAIALYFAILKVHPTPFCVMDEIEAALDEPNVVRVANYMRRITQKTQFIVITHRRGTMEAADVLYGVTMQERGVSKVLTINMNDMAKELNIKE